MTTATFDFFHAHGKSPAIKQAAKTVMTYLWDAYMRSQTKRAQSYIELYAPKDRMPKF